MYVIKLEDFARLYRALKIDATISEREWARNFRLRNPQCPEIIEASSFKEALELNNTRFDYQ